ncbi:S41 family peptidase [Lentibacillus saliphilus]|uniref:S41 family peptidase n=1 Tax=Lentibacillus saliphilus TaxID=2737028 RepID=UPI001C30AAA0|nr:S41 family peptidase [Lentibacillus saliphilus]
MKMKKLHIVLILMLAFVLGLSGAYVGSKLAQTDQPIEQEEGATNNQSNADRPDTVQPDKLSKVTQTYALIKEHFIEDVEDQKLIEGAIQGMLQVLEDPFTSYMDAETMKSFNEQIESSFEGIGAEVSLTNGVVTIVSPIKDSPAEAAGLRPNDKVLSVDGESIAGLDLNEAVEKIRGEKGSEVVLEIQRTGISESFDVTIVRDEIPVETVYSDMKTADGKKTGIIEIASFSEHTAEEFTTHLNQLEEDGMNGLVIDVRGNPGGILEVVEDILGHFIPSDMPYIQIENPDGTKDKFYSSIEGKKDYPINVLIDEGSASASEILAVAMKEAGYDVIGKTSYGKGTVQKAIPIDEDGSAIKLTFYKWLSPNGKWINEVGVEPTIEVDQPEYYYTSPIDVEEPLQYDQTGEKIKNIQLMLEGLGYNPGRKDGYFNQETEAAVKAFQADEKLTSSGQVDKDTAGRLAEKMIQKVRSGDDDRQLEEALNVLY